MSNKRAHTQTRERIWIYRKSVDEVRTRRVNDDVAGVLG